jgi:hypothetical protein
MRSAIKSLRRDEPRDRRHDCRRTCLHHLNGSRGSKRSSCGCCKTPTTHNRPFQYCLHNRCNGSVTEEVNSPTFAIVNEYEGTKGVIYHFDFYRINRPEEALDFGLYDYFDSGNPCLMEWPECIEPLLPDDTIKIEISVIDNNTRQIKMDD